MTAVEVMAFVWDAMRKISSVFCCLLFSVSAMPKALWYTIRPFLAIKATAPGISPLSMDSWIMLSTQVNLSPEMPTFMGLPSVKGRDFCPDLVWAFRLSNDSDRATVSKILILYVGFIWLKIIDGTR